MTGPPVYPALDLRMAPGLVFDSETQDEHNSVVAWHLDEMAWHLNEITQAEVP